MHRRPTSIALAVTLALLAAPAAALATPVLISKLRWSKRFARAGQNVVATYVAGASTTLSFAIVNAAGVTVRDLGDGVPINAGPHGVDWDGYAGTTLALPDGRYELVLTSSDPNGITGTTAAPIAIDSHGALIHFKSLRLKPRKRVRISVTDPVSGVNRATLIVDNRIVARSFARSVEFAYRPPGGWARGRHTVIVEARDRTWNFSSMTRTVVVR